MAKLKDLLSNIPTTVVETQKAYEREQVMREVMRRKNASYLKRVGGLRQEDNVFGNCQTRRPNKGKAKNRYSREEAGTCGTMTMGIRTGAYSVCVCKTQNKW